MYHYGGATPKRHYMLCNSPHIKDLMGGQLKGWIQHKMKLEEEGKHVSLVQKYIDKSGKRRYKGTKSLKGSESGTQLKACTHACQCSYKRT